MVFLSGEAGLEALKATADRICRERGLSLESLENFHLSPDLPRLDRPVDLMALRELIEVQQPICLVIDPISLAMGDSNSRNPFAVGALLRELVELCDTTGCAILVVHHAKRSHKAGSPPTLDDIAWSGFAEFSAQWLLVSRRRPYNPDTGHHELWLSAGGRAGHAGLWALDVDEGAHPRCRTKDRWRPPAKTAALGRRFCARSPGPRLKRTNSSSPPGKIASSVAEHWPSSVKASESWNCLPPTRTAARPASSGTAWA